MLCKISSELLEKLIENHFEKFANRNKNELNDFKLGNGNLKISVPQINKKMLRLENINTTLNFENVAKGIM